MAAPTSALPYQRPGSYCKWHTQSSCPSRQRMQRQRHMHHCSHHRWVAGHCKELWSQQGGSCGSFVGILVQPLTQGHNSTTWVPPCAGAGAADRWPRGRVSSTRGMLAVHRCFAGTGRVAASYHTLLCNSIWQVASSAAGRCVLWCNQARSMMERLVNEQPNASLHAFGVGRGVDKVRLPMLRMRAAAKL
jgi:hypothetical protein